MTYGSTNDDESDDPHPSIPFLAPPDHIQQMTLQSIVDDVTIARQLWRDHVKSDI